MLNWMKKRRFLVAGFLAMASYAAISHAQDAAAAEEALDVAGTFATHKVLLDTLWVMITAFLVFWMQAGFAYVESGFTRAKNSNNIMMKNLMDFCMGTVAFFVVGFAFMFGDGNDFIGTTGFFLMGADNSPATGDAYQGVYSAIAWAGVPLYAKFMFQLVFAATAATIISGAIAERTRFDAYLIISLVVSAFIYPVVGHWIWGGGWLADRGMWDFAGSTVVHSVGGWLSLVGAIVVGARIGKYSADGKPRAIPGHSLPMATLGVFILWLGWFGFNPGSTMAADTSIGLIALNTNIAAAVGGLAAMFTSKVMFKTYDIGMTLNGVLAGLVAITAGCAFVSPVSSFVIGIAGGVLVVLAVVFFDKIHVDDPVGAISVHGICGSFGTICVGLFAQEGFAPANTTGNGLLFGGGATLLVAQLTGVAAVFIFCMITGFALFLGLKHTIGIRVSAAEEDEGLDVAEHGIAAYPDIGFYGTKPASVTNSMAHTVSPSVAHHAAESAT